MSVRKIAFFLPSLSGGGAERIIVNLANHMARIDCEVDLILGVNQCEEAYIEDVDYRVNIIRLNSRSTFLSLFKLSEKIKESNYITIMSSLTHSNIVLILSGILSKVQTKIIIREANTPSKESEKSLKLKLINFIAKFVYKLSDVVVSVSDGVHNDMVNFYQLPREKCLRIYNPINLNKIYCETKKSKDHKWFGKYQLILGVGRLSKQKDFGTLIKAYSLLSDDLKKNTKVIIVGKGPEYIKLRELALSLNVDDSIDFYGHTNSVYQLMHSSDIFVLPSLYEGLPGVLIEALACGCNIIASDNVPGSREVLNNGKFGSFFKTQDPNSLRVVLEEKLCNKDYFSGPDPDLSDYLQHNFGDKNLTKYERLMLDESK
ncbi:glycosyltransferase [Vibrio cyclitrophicus]